MTELDRCLTNLKTAVDAIAWYANEGKYRAALDCAKDAARFLAEVRAALAASSAPSA